MMDDLKHLYLDDLIQAALSERLIDACELRGEHVLIVQGTMRVMLSPARAHAFLRGVIQGMSRTRFHPAYVEQTYGRRTVMPPPPARRSEEVPDGNEMLGAFRKHMLSKWWQRYETAGCPFARTTRGLTLWVQYNTSTTTS